MMPPVFSLENIHRQYLRCRRNKGNTINALRFEYDLEENLMRLYEELNRKTYTPSRSVCFVVTKPKEILYRIIAKRIRSEEILWLAKTVIFHDCTKEVVFKGRKALLKEVPAHKTLFNKQNRIGLPIGNLTSQFLANVYLNELDQFVKHHLKAKYYIRYCDDLVLLSRERKRLLYWREKVSAFLKLSLRLSLNDVRQATGPIKNGIDFLGYIVRPDYLLARQRVVNHLKERLMEHQKGRIKVNDGAAGKASHSQGSVQVLPG